MDVGSCLAQYTGHVGSVNGVAFGPSTTDSNEFMLATASGDRTAHIWKAIIPGWLVVKFGLFLLLKESTGMLMAQFALAHSILHFTCLEKI